MSQEGEAELSLGFPESETTYPRDIIKLASQEKSIGTE